MEVCRRSSWLLLLLGVSLLAAALQGVQGEAESEGPSESECRPYIEKALKELEVGEAGDETGDSNEDIPTVEVTTDDSDHQEGEGDDDTHEEGNASTESEQHSDEQEDTKEEAESVEQERSAEDSDTNEETEGSEDSKQSADDKNESVEEKREDVEAAQAESVEDQPSKEEENDSKVDDNDSKADDNDSKAEDNDSKTGNDSHADDNDSKADDNDSKIDDNDSKADDNDSKVNDNDSKADDNDSKADENDSKSDDGSKTHKDSKEDDKSVETEETKTDDDDDDDSKTADSKEGKDSPEKSNDDDDSKEEASEDGDNDSKESEEAPEEELTLETEVPNELRPRDHVEHLLKLDPEASEKEAIINRVSEITLRDLKKLYENAIKPLETLYKYRDLSNRHFGDAEIFSKPLILFMGPWSGGKSSIINYLLDNEYNETSLRTGAEPSPAYFNILMHGEEPEIVEGTELAADFTFSGLQKFGQGLEERLRGVKLPSELLEKVNIVEIPGILEVRKQVSRVFPFNDACQWFIDRADIIFLVYDPSKLDVGPETEAILDQLKGREHQTRIVLNKADQVKPEELMRVQGALIWNISPLMSSPQPPIMYTVSLWSKPYEPWAPVRLLKAQERAFLRDLRSAIDKRIDNKIASARRFAVRVRNHAKMVDCYLTTYYNHKSVFGNRNQVADEIIDHPQDYHIYEGLSTLTNISRYDLPDPEVYRDFFKLNALYDFKQLSATCTYFRGCPINRLDIAIAYDLPELVGKHKRLVESALTEANQEPGS